MKLVMGETFGESVGKVVLNWNMGGLNGVVEYLLSKIVMSHVDVFGAIMSNRILGELNGGIVVIENGKGTRDRVTKGFEKSAEPDCLSGSISGSHVFSFRSRESCGWLSSGFPGYRSSKSSEEVSGSRSASIQTSAPVSIGVAQDDPLTRGSVIGEAEFDSALEVAKQVSSSMDMLLVPLADGPS
jgi:hypothetical protein